MGLSVGWSLAAPDAPHAIKAPKSKTPRIADGANEPSCRCKNCIDVHAHAAASVDQGAADAMRLGAHTPYASELTDVRFRGIVVCMDIEHKGCRVNALKKRAIADFAMKFHE
jgi:hypothetical protein